MHLHHRGARLLAHFVILLSNIESNFCDGGQKSGVEVLRHCSCWCKNNFFHQEAHTTAASATHSIRPVTPRASPAGALIESS